ncbi:MAG: TRAP transporter permease [Syntrophaceae bacterium]|nr:TRAP transporter permease [Syntrophaceae bacterium]
MDTLRTELKTQAQSAAKVLFFIASVFFFVYLFRYYMTGIGGPTLIAVTLVPVTFILFTLDALRNNNFYPRLSLRANYILAGIYIVVCLVVILYLKQEFMNIRTVRAGIWSPTDLVIGGLMFALIMEYARKRHFPLFVINLLLIAYTVYGWMVPGLFWHPGLSWTRILSAMSVEITTGVFSHLPQLALTLIGSFILVLSLLRAFGCVDSIINAASRIATKSSLALPQAAVVGSLGVATISGSGAANAITTGSATIPAMIASGLPRTNAAAIETAASLGGQLMPPVMGISAFIMAEFLGKSYWDVVARGYAPGLIYFAGVAVGVYLLSVRYQTNIASVSIPQITPLDKVNLLVYAAVIIGLIALMGAARLPAMVAALRVFVGAGLALSAIFFIATYRTHGSWNLRNIAAPFLRFVENFSTVIADLTLLLATLSIMTGVFVITGIPTKVGFLLMEAAGLHLVAMILVAFLFAALVGTGLPPAPTYIITALVIAPSMIKIGVNPWVVHFYAFFLAVWGELTPPTSVVAAVTAKIADTSFMGTLFKAIQLCVVLFLLMAGIFSRPELVLTPGLAQLGTFGLFLAATVGMQFSIQAKYSDKKGRDLFIRVLLAGFSLLVLFHPNKLLATLAIAPIGALVWYWFLQKRKK